MVTEFEPRNIIYGLSCTCHPEKGIRYVGLTTRGFADRWSGHLIDLKRKPNTPVYRWIAKHGPNNVVHKILATSATIEELSPLEIDWIDRLRSSGADLLNQTGGGSGSLALQPSLETRRKMSEAQKRVGFTEARKAGLAAAQLAAMAPGVAQKRHATWQRNGSSKRPWSEASRASLSKVKSGTNNGRAILGEDQVREIRERALNGENQTALGATFGVSRQTVSNIKLDKSWAVARAN